jgi:hypothetical protein
MFAHYLPKTKTLQLIFPFLLSMMMKSVLRDAAVKGKELEQKGRQ